MAIELDQPPAAATRASTERPFANWSTRGKVLGVGERRFFTERLALLLETGTPLHAALRTLADQARSETLRRLLDDLQENVSGGRTFAEALARHGDAFPSTYVNLVGAAETGGFLDEVLRRLAEMDERNARLRASIRASLFYPAFLLTFSVFVTIFVLTVVFPKFAPLFASIADHLPGTTIALMAASELLRQHWAALSAGLVATLLLLRWWLLSPTGTAWLDRLKLGLPGVRDLYAQFYLSRVMRVLALSLTHGVSVMDALSACRGLIRNVEFDALLAEVQTDVEQGRGVAPAFARSRFVPEMVRQMVSTGEESARLPLVMGRIADFYERELTRRLETLSKLVEPVMLLVMGAIVGLLVSSLILPIFKLSRIAH